MPSGAITEEQIRQDLLRPLGGAGLGYLMVAGFCALIVAAILAFSACKAAIIAFRTAGSSGRMGVSLDMPSPTMIDQVAP